jgi:hypothetical protein
MKKSGSRILSLVLALLIPILWMAENASAAKLREVRTGKKSGFTRLVFQFEAPTRYQVQDKTAPSQFSITFLEATSGVSQKNQKYVDPVTNIAINQDGSRLKTVVALSIPHFRLKTFTLTEPHRVVVDLYPAAAAESYVRLNKLVVKASAEGGATPKAPPPAPIKEPEPPARKLEPLTKEPEPLAKKPEPPAVVDSQLSVLESKPEVLEPVEVSREPAPALSIEKASKDNSQPATPPVPPSSRPMASKDSSANKPTSSAFGTFQRNLIIVLAAISIVILALIGFLLLQKKNSAEKSRPVESVQELKTTADIMASIDARIKQKFKQYEEEN